MSENAKRKKSPFTQDFENLPNTIPVFPLNGAVVLPGSLMPLNIFEPRYLDMIRDAMKSEQLIGMIQVKDELSPPSLQAIGCAARIIRYSETSDGRIEILLEGLCRFRVHEELSCLRGYRLVQADWSSYQTDFDEPEPASEQDALLFSGTLKKYFEEQSIDVDWSSVEDLPQDTLVSNLVTQLALSSDDKQLLIEASNLSDRVKVFTAILASDEGSTTIRH